MKATKIIGLFFIISVFNGIQAMDFPQQPTLEQQLSGGNISIDQYLQLLGSSNYEYQFMLNRLMYADYSMVGFNYYDNFLNAIGRMLRLANISNMQSGTFRKKVEAGIRLAYNNLVDAEKRGLIKTKAH